MRPTTDYRVTHSWGDPRSPEHCNGIRIGYVSYSEGACYLWFKLIGEYSGDHKAIRWTLKAPKNMRTMLIGRWDQHQLVLKRIVDYLKAANIRDTFEEEDRYQSILIDMSELPTWFVSQVAHAKEKLKPISCRLPKQNAIAVFLIGLVLHFAWQGNLLPSLQREQISMILLALAVIILAVLIKEGSQWYKAIRSGLAITAFAKRQPLSQWSCLKTTLQAYWPRALSTLALAGWLCGLSFQGS